jgi:hypothetical protein
MTLPPTFSRRKAEAIGSSDVYQYDDVPRKVRVQIVHVMNSTLGSYLGHQYSSVNPHTIWTLMYEHMIKELGVFTLDNQYTPDKSEEFTRWMLKEQNLDAYLDGLEISLQAIDGWARRNNLVNLRIARTTPDRAIAEINARLREAQVGYQYVSGELIRVDSQLLHAETVVPALTLLGEAPFAAANTEFRQAHKAYREGRNEDAIIGAAKAFESVLKVIGEKRRWPVTENDTATKLLAAAFDAGFLTNLVQTGFTSLRSLLESGIPTPRNKTAGHGAGAVVRVVPEHMAAFVLYQTAAAILFLHAQDRQTPENRSS